MRLRPTSEYIKAIRAVLPNSEVVAPDYRTIVQRTAERLRLTQEELQATRSSGSKRRSIHRSVVSAILFRMKNVGEVRAVTGQRNNRNHCQPYPTRYCGTVRYPTHEEIACRAYEIYASREYTNGYDKQDWLQAERELLEE